MSKDPGPGDIYGLFFFFLVAPNSMGSKGPRCYGFAVTSESASCLHKNPGLLSPAMYTLALRGRCCVVYISIWYILPSVVIIGDSNLQETLWVFFFQRNPGTQNPRL